jgi:Icc-related predicted phosphoesterase
MKILVISDLESKYLWDYFQKEKLEGIDLILSCGDLNPQYLSFLACFTKAPVLYVHGNHDDCYETTPPEGCICIEDKIYVYQNLRIMGLGGSFRYKEGKNQYTEKQMCSRIKKMRLKLRKYKGIDILLTHAPAAGINDGQDHVHKGFESFVNLIDEYKPKYFIHGHVHQNYQCKFVREQKYHDTIIVNGYERYIIDTDVSENSVQVQ